MTEDEIIKKMLQENLEISRKVLEEMEKQRRHRKIMLVITIVVIVLPILLAIAAIPWAMSTLDSYYGDLLSI